MDLCSSCQREFGYWEVWRSISRWKGVWEINCRHCGERNSATRYGQRRCSIFIGMPAFLIAFIINWKYDLDFFSGFVILLFFVLVFSFFGPLARPYDGRKPKDVDR